MTAPYPYQAHFNYAQASYLLPTPKPPKPPIHNPYDKFTQPEFDAWIGGITGALKRALGQEDEVEQEPKAQGAYLSPAFGDYEAELPDGSESLDEAVDDSFAEIKARRALGKGKARDPREGPGLGTGDVYQPIEIDSDSEEEQEEVEESEEEEEEGSEEWDEDEENSGEEEQAWSTGESSAQARIRHAKREADSGDECEDEEQLDQEYSGEEEPEAQGADKEEVILLSSDGEQDEEGDDSIEYDDDEPEYGEPSVRTRGSRTHQVEVIDDEGVHELDPEQEAEYISDTEEVYDVDQDDNPESEDAQAFVEQDEEPVAPLPPRFLRVAPTRSFEVLEDEEDLVDESPHKESKLNEENAIERAITSTHFNGLTEASPSSPKSNATRSTPDTILHESGGTGTPETKTTHSATVQQEVYEIIDDEDEAADGSDDGHEEEGEGGSTSELLTSPTEPHHAEASVVQLTVYDVDMKEDELESVIIQPVTEDTCKDLARCHWHLLISIFI
jgi:hypothetical protein